MKDRILTIILFCFTFPLYATGLQVEECTETNNYLEERIQTFQTENPTFYGVPMCQYDGGILEGFSRIGVFAAPLMREVDDMSYCILHSMKHHLNPGRGIRYINCVSENDNVHTRRYEAPCLSDSYHELVYRSFKRVAECLNLSEGETQEYFMMVNHESRFMINVTNSNNTTGIAQMTTSGMAQIHQNFPSEDGVMDGSGISDLIDDNPACAMIPETLNNPLDNLSIVRQRVNDANGRFSHYNYVRRGSANLCSRAYIPTNPLRSFVYGMLLYKFYKEQAENLFNLMFNNQARNRVARIHSEDRRKIIRDLTFQIYNGGYQGIRNVINRLVTEGRQIAANHQANSSLPYEDKGSISYGGQTVTLPNERTIQTWAYCGGRRISYDYFKTHFPSMVANYYSGDTARKIEVARYSNKVHRDTAAIEQEIQTTYNREVTCRATRL